jgi:two-component system, sensor histidine kinase and response regulator
MDEKVNTILLIDDEQGLLVGLSAVMKRAGYRVLTATNGSQGAQMAKELQPDIIVCDVMMPPPNGFELKRLLARDPITSPIPFIFLTARSSESDMLYGFDAGADDYITKPFSRNELLARVSAVIQRNEKGKQSGLVDLEAKLNLLRQEISDNITQEFQAPLGIIYHTLETIIDDKLHGNLQQQRLYIESALDNAERLNLLIDDLVSLSEIGTEKFKGLRQPIDLEEDFKTPIAKCLYRWQDRHLVVNISISSEVIINAPKLGFRQAVNHLVDNACKFSPERGELDIKLSTRGIGGCLLTVRDEGIGIPLDMREKVFERYYQVPPEPGLSSTGLGIGLSITRAFARSLGGDVVILDSNKGCRIQMMIPPGNVDFSPEEFDG